MRRRSSAAFACMRAGISSENSSNRRSGINGALCEVGGACAAAPPLPATRFVHGGRGEDTRAPSLDYLHSSSKSRSPGTVRKRTARFRMDPGVATGFRKFTHAHDVALTLGHRNHAACIQQIEHVAGLDALVIGRQRHQMFLALAILPPRIEISAAGVLGHPELLE